MRWEELMSEKDCIFCKIVGGEMESEAVLDEEESWPSRSQQSRAGAGGLPPARTRSRDSRDERT
jgi:hypothetical protein